MRNKYESIFNNLTDSKFEDILNQCGFDFKKVDGEGGLFIDGERVYSYELKEEYATLESIVKNIEEKLYTKMNSLGNPKDINYFNDFEVLESLLVA